MTESICPRCGMARAHWQGTGGGYHSASGLCCCRGCAEGPACTCATPERAPQPATQMRARSGGNWLEEEELVERLVNQRYRTPGKLPRRLPSRRF